MTAPNPNPFDEMDERIDKRLSLLRDSIELKLGKEMDALLKSRFDSTGKILGWAFGLVALVVTGFGIKTIFDVREVARTTAIEEVKKKLAIEDPNSEFRQDIDKTVARGLIDSYLLSLAKGKQERFRPELAISETDLRRLQNLIGDPITSTKDFSDAFEVLLRSSERSRNESTDRLVQAFASGSDAKYRWIREQPDKRAALFRLYPGDKLVSIAREILGDEKSEKELLIAAIKYSGAKDSESGNLLERLTKNRDENVSSAALLALARVEPKSEALKAALDKPKSSNRGEDWVTSIRIAIEIAKPSRRRVFDEDPDIPERNRIAAAALQQAIDNEYFFRLSHDFSERSTESLYVSSRKVPGMLYGISSDIILGASFGALRELLRRSASISNSEQLFRNLRALCLEEDGRCRGVVKANLQRGGRFDLQTGFKIDQTEAPAGVALRPANTKPDSTIIVTWSDPDANSKSGTLASISDADQIEFSVATTRTLNVDELEE